MIRNFPQHNLLFDIREDMISAVDNVHMEMVIEILERLQIKDYTIGDLTILFKSKLYDSSICNIILILRSEYGVIGENIYCMIENLKLPEVLETPYYHDARDILVSYERYAYHYIGLGVKENIYEMPYELINKLWNVLSKPPKIKNCFLFFDTEEDYVAYMMLIS